MLFGSVVTAGASGSPPSSGEEPSAPMMNGTTVPSSSLTRPATGDGGRPPPSISVDRSVVPSLAGAALA
jgi:hypothetical protein